jgi:hypothetical protein
MNAQNLAESFKRTIELSAFRDPLGKLTRQRQLGLLITSVVLIILASGIATLSEATIFGVKFEPAKREQLVGLTALLCLYFFAGFIMGCVEDWRRQRIGRIPGEFERVNLKEVLKSKLVDRRKQFDRMHVDFEKLVARRNELSAQMDTGSEIERDRAAAALKDVLANDGMDQLADRMLDFATDLRLNEQVWGLYRVSSSVSAFDRARLLFEILFPVLLGIAALGSALLFVFS